MNSQRPQTITKNYSLRGHFTRPKKPNLAQLPHSGQLSAVLYFTNYMLCAISGALEKYDEGLLMDH